jgi:hypothetical protein
VCSAGDSLQRLHEERVTLRSPQGFPMHKHTHPSAACVDPFCCLIGTPGISSCQPTSTLSPALFPRLSTRVPRDPLDVSHGSSRFAPVCTDRPFHHRAKNRLRSPLVSTRSSLLCDLYIMYFILQTTSTLISTLFLTRVLRDPLDLSHGSSRFAPVCTARPFHHGQKKSSPVCCLRRRVLLCDVYIMYFILQTTPTLSPA